MKLVALMLIIIALSEVRLMSELQEIYQVKKGSVKLFRVLPRFCVNSKMIV